eukprot:8427631-Pyramimonas_sp.AAC.1
MSLARAAGAWEKYAGPPAPDDVTSVFGQAEQTRVAVARACPRRSFSSDGGVQKPVPRCAAERLLE